MLKKISLAAVAVLTLRAPVCSRPRAVMWKTPAFSFEGPFGSYDELQLQRGLKVYTQVCSSCHGLKYVPIRTIGNEGGPNLPDDQVRAYADFYEVYDPEADEYRPAKPTDHFPESQFEGAPDLSSWPRRARAFTGPMAPASTRLLKGMGGPEYIVSLLKGYTARPRQRRDDAL